MGAPTWYFLLFYIYITAQMCYNLKKALFFGKESADVSNFQDHLPPDGGGLTYKEAL